MKKRHVAGSIILFIFAPLLRAQTTESCRTFVQTFYYAYTKDDANNYAKEIKRHPDYFSKELRNALTRLSKLRDVGRIDFDPFLNGQDIVGYYEAQRVRIDRSECEISLSAPTFQGGPMVPLVTTRLHSTGEARQITDFVYPPHDSTPVQTLIELLKRSTKETN